MANQSVSFTVSWFPLHDPALCPLICQRDGRDLKKENMSVGANSYWTMLTYNVCSNADEDYGYWTKWKRDTGQDEEEEWSELRYVGC